MPRDWRGLRTLPVELLLLKSLTIRERKSLSQAVGQVRNHVRAPARVS